MPNFAIVVEGAHDASFLGQLLKARGFAGTNKLSSVPNDWRILFPRSFPKDGDSLERVMRFPEIFTHGDTSVGITTSGSDSLLISTLRSVIDAVGSNTLSGIAVFLDVDMHDSKKRFSDIRNQIISMNNSASAEQQPGYPIVVPNTAGVMEDGKPAVGIFLFPDNINSGALEDIILECAMINHPTICTAAVKLVEELDRNCPENQADLRLLRAGMGRGKAKVGAIANLLKPGASVASSLAQTSWLAKSAPQNPLVLGANAFLTELLQDGKT